MRWDKALKCKALAEESLRELMPGFFTSSQGCDEVKVWLDEEEKSCQCALKPGTSK